MKTAKSVIESAMQNDNEPIIIFRAKDGLTRDLLTKYIADCIANNCPQKHIAEMVNIREDFVNWQNNHEGKVELPD
jgi:hypothetical protein